MKYIICLFFGLSLSLNVKTQEKRSTVEIVGSSFFNSERHATKNGEQKIYGEVRLGYRFNRYFEVNVFAGYQQRSFIYYAQFDSPWQLIPLYMDRHYTPIGIGARLYLSDFFFEKLKAWKRKGKWDVYNEIGLAVLKGSDKNDSRDETYRAQGAYVPYYLIPYEVEYNKIYLIYVAGIRYNFGGAMGIFLEGGEGALMNLQLGISCKL